MRTPDATRWPESRTRSEGAAVDLRGAGLFAVPEPRADVCRGAVRGCRRDHDGGEDRQCMAVALRRASTCDDRTELWRHILKEIDRLLACVLGDSRIIGLSQSVD